LYDKLKFFSKQKFGKVIAKRGRDFMEHGVLRYEHRLSRSQKESQSGASAWKLQMIITLLSNNLAPQMP